MVVAVDLIYLIEAGAGGHIDLAADDGLDARLLGRFVELDAAVHDAVVGDGDGVLTALLDTVHKLVDAAGTVQKAVFGMDVKMDEVSPRAAAFAHARTSSVSVLLLCSASRWRSASARASSFSSGGKDPICSWAGRSWHRAPPATGRDISASGPPPAAAPPAAFPAPPARPESGWP